MIQSIIVKIYLCFRRVKTKVSALDDVNGEAVSLAFKIHWAKSGFEGAPEVQKPFADRTASDVIAHVAFEVWPADAPDDFGRGCFSGLVRSSKAYMIDAIDPLSE